MSDIKWISIRHGLETDAHTSSLGIYDNEPGVLRVTGVISHGKAIRPATQADADALRAWLDIYFPVPRTRTLATELATRLEAIHNCIKSGNEAGRVRHARIIKRLCADCLPSGAGFDDGTQFELDASSVSRLIFATSFHHKTQDGVNDGWTSHRVTVAAGFNGPRVLVTGPDRILKDNIAEVFLIALAREITDEYLVSIDKEVSDGH